MTRPLRIVVGGMVAAVPGQGGATWAVLQYLLGLARLGHEVYFVEALDGDVLRPSGAPVNQSVNARYCHQVMREHGLSSSWALLRSGTQETAGLSYPALERLGREASVLIDIAGTLADQDLFSRVPIRVYLDLDPAFTQLWDAQGIDMRLEGHTHFVTVGQGIGSPGCLVPEGGRSWVTTWQPVVLDQWPVSDHIALDGFTTVANWRSYGSVDHDGVHYGQKAHSVRTFMELPTRTPEALLLALAIDEAEVADLEALRENGWRLLDPVQAARSPSAYRRFVRGSKAELGIAKSGYVRSNSGWFSDRSVCYLASGRPVLAQETGFSRHLPIGNGLLAFETTDEIVEGIESICADYGRHSVGARDLAEDIFDSDKVLGRLLAEIGAPT